MIDAKSAPMPRVVEKMIPQSAAHAQLFSAGTPSLSVWAGSIEEVKSANPATVARIAPPDQQDPDRQPDCEREQQQQAHFKASRS